ncbi:hypothetical protein [Lactiplantibacillus herbarum]|uniref:hypothetical protein n=1 Tax=Lactiplantibacillus herbarum TaxID=1670446 RepID=UPI000A6F5F93|nr:hypothetical protein [Lactiplantibacillus herbarum]
MRQHHLYRLLLTLTVCGSLLAVPALDAHALRVRGPRMALRHTTKSRHKTAHHSRARGRR